MRRPVLLSFLLALLTACGSTRATVNTGSDLVRSSSSASMTTRVSSCSDAVDYMKSAKDYALAADITFYDPAWLTSHGQSQTHRFLSCNFLLFGPPSSQCSGTETTPPCIRMIIVRDDGKVVGEYLP